MTSWTRTTGLKRLSWSGLQTPGLISRTTAPDGPTRVLILVEDFGGVDGIWWDVLHLYA